MVVAPAGESTAVRTEIQEENRVCMPCERLLQERGPSGIMQGPQPDGVVETRGGK